jgi:uncharacterized membrane protein
MATASVISTSNRIASIDLLRGIVMIIMALDHVRDFFHAGAFSFSLTDNTSTSLFITRWITHLCAPTFILLAGTSAYFVAQRKTLKETSVFLITRGIWLIILQFTLIRFGWNLDPLFRYNSNTIISVIGICMIAMAGLIHLRFNAILIIGIVLVAGHNLLDSVSFPDGTFADVLWSFLHVPKTYYLNNNYIFFFYYPVLPWIGVIALGYCLGRLYDATYTSERRKRILLLLSGLGLFVFLVLRIINVYGDPVPWSKQPELANTLISFFNLEKYPPSLLFLCATLWISMLLLALMEGKDLKRWRSITLFGNTALFYYVTHIYLIHLLAVGAVILSGFSWRTMIFLGQTSKGSPELQENYGFGLDKVYLIWIVIVILLYPLCVWWNNLKSRNKGKWWVSYV